MTIDSTAPPAETVLTQLAGYRDITLAHLLASLPDREPQRYLYGPIREHLSRMGKGLRPAMCLATCRAFGGSDESARQSALALEMLHNAFLVHDDVEDESEYRRTAPTMHMAHGVPLAVNAGDALHSMSLRLLRDNLGIVGPRRTWQILTEFDHMMLQSVEGQATELGWIRDNRCDVTPGDYLTMTLKKTSWYSFIHPLRIGALIGSDGRAPLDRFNRFGYYMGTAFQIQDDVLNLVGDRRKYGKEIGGDLLEGKRTLMLIHLLERSSREERVRLESFLGRARLARTSDEVDWALGRMRSYGSIDYAQSVSRHFAGAALYEYQNAFGGLSDSADKDFIRDIILYMINRDL